MSNIQKISVSTNKNETIKVSFQLTKNMYKKINKMSLVEDFALELLSNIEQAVVNDELDSMNKEPIKLEE